MWKVKHVTMAEPNSRDKKVNRLHTREQRAILWKQFNKVKGEYPSAARKKEIEDETGSTETQVNNWFTNFRRREKAKREKKELKKEERERKKCEKDKCEKEKCEKEKFEKKKRKKPQLKQYVDDNTQKVGDNREDDNDNTEYYENSTGNDDDSTEHHENSTGNDHGSTGNDDNNIQLDLDNNQRDLNMIEFRLNNIQSDININQHPLNDIQLDHNINPVELDFNNIHLDENNISNDEETHTPRPASTPPLDEDSEIKPLELPLVFEDPNAYSRKCDEELHRLMDEVNDNTMARAESSQK